MLKYSFHQRKFEYLRDVAEISGWQQRLTIGLICSLLFLIIASDFISGNIIKYFLALTVFTAFVFEDLSRDIQIEYAKNKNDLIMRGRLKFDAFFKPISRGELEADLSESALYASFRVFGRALLIEVIILLTLLVNTFFG